MDLAQRFEQYADDFDRTVADEDWSRIRPYFTEDAVREEHMLPLMSFCHTGIDEIIEQWRSMVANFDRRFDRRVLVRVSPARQEGAVVTLHWVGIYCVPGAPALLGEGHEVARFRGARIEHLESIATKETVQRNMEWAAQYGDRVPGLLEWAATLAPAST
jgi:hypothetical protein